MIDYCYSWSSSLEMTNNADYICVGGDFLIQNGWLNNITAGVLEVKGDFTQKNKDNFFAASGTNIVKLSGSRTQTVSIDNLGIYFGSIFNTLQLSNPNGIVFSTQIAVNQLIGGGNINVDGRYLGVAGNYTLQNDSLLEMTNADDYVFVNGKFTTNTSNDEWGSLRDGVLETAGDFSQGGNEYLFAATGDFDVILSGSTVQNIYFANPNTSQFNNLDRMDTGSIKCNYISSDDKNSLFQYWQGFKDFVLVVLSSIYNNGIEDLNILLTFANSLFGREYAGETYRMGEEIKQGVIEGIENLVTNVVAYDAGKIITDLVLAGIGVYGISVSVDSTGQIRNRANAGIEPKNSLDLFGESIPVPDNPKERFTFDKDTNTLHRFFQDGNGTWHWSGSTNQGANSLRGRDVPNEIKNIFNLPKKEW